MSFTSRKKRPLDRSVEHLGDTYIIVVAIEGAKREKLYFEFFNNKRVQLHVIPNNENKSSPKYIKENLDGFADEYQIGSDDQLWLAIDVDDWSESELSEVVRECTQKGYYLAVSNPCFELWLLLHFKALSKEYSTCSEVKEELNPILDEIDGENYEKLFSRHAKDAVNRARKLDTDESIRWPLPQGTRIYKIIEQII